MEHDNVVKILKEICDIESDDRIEFEYLGDSPIRKDDVYGGFSIILEGRLGNIKQRFDIDLATGDIIYPKDNSYDYECLITNEHIMLKSYSIESIVAEKLQTFLYLGPFNSRSKDFYDLYIFKKLKINDENLNMFKEAYNQTCLRRNFVISKENALINFNNVKNNQMQLKRWNSYSKKVKYAKKYFI